MPAGRPTAYKEEYGPIVEDFMAAGYSKMVAAGNIGVCYNTLKAWMVDHPEFLTAVKRGEAKRAAKLEQDLLEAETGPKVTSRIFALKNAAPDEWRDKVVSEVVGKDDGPVKHEVTSDPAFARIADRLTAIEQRSRAASEAASE